ncbi:MAG: YggT family protein [Chloroflexota bacterium]|nr:YggT family protein [Chloroflexota bacterium]
MRDDLGRRPGDEPYEDDTQIIRRERRIEPHPPDVVEDRYVERAPYVDPEPVRERYVEERRVEPAPYVDPAPVRERYVEERYADRSAVAPDRRTARDRRRSLARTARLIYFVFGVIESLIAIRALLRLLGANPVGFARFIYDITYPFVAPFIGLFREPRLGVAVLEFSSLVAIIVYALLAYALVRLIYLFYD